MNCHDCGATPGTEHDHGCDAERCPRCRGQLISCSCIYEVNGIDRSTMATEHPEIYRNGPTKAMEAVFDAEIEKLGGWLPWTGESWD